MKLAVFVPFPLLAALGTAELARCGSGSCDNGEELSALLQGGPRSSVHKNRTSLSEGPLHVKCLYSNTMCAGNQCCPRAEETGGKTYPCPSASPGWNECESSGASDALTIRLTIAFELCLQAGTPVILTECTGERDQLWKFKEDTKAYKSLADLTQCLDAGDMSNDVEVTMGACSGEQSQRWATAAVGSFLHIDGIWSRAMIFDASRAGGGTRVVVWDTPGCWDQKLTVYSGGPGYFPCQDMDLSNETDMDRCIYYAVPGLANQSAGFGSSCPHKLLPEARPNQAAGERQFQKGCLDGENGWPKFESEQQLIANSAWRAYYEGVYGESITSGFPICVFDLWVLNMSVYNATVKSDRAYITDRPQPGMYFWKVGDFFDRYNPRSPDFYYNSPGSIYHSNNRFAPFAADDTWVEVTHQKGGVTGEGVGMWLLYAPGSNIWFNTGKTRSYASHEEAALDLCGKACMSTDLASVNCDDMTAQCARNKGIDSYQFVYGWSYVMNVEMVAVNFAGSSSCGMDFGQEGPVGWKKVLFQSSFRTGWMASRACECDNTVSDSLNCGGTWSKGALPADDERK